MKGLVPECKTSLDSKICGYLFFIASLDSQVAYFINFFLQRTLNDATYFVFNLQHVDLESEQESHHRITYPCVRPPK